jgi:hypothetical protein
MINRSTLLSTFLTLFTATAIAQVSVSTKLPATVAPGGNFNVELSVSKGDISGFAKLQQQLPPGFTATAGEVANATFSFKDQKVKFLWMALPNGDFKVTYNVVVDASLSGNQIIDGGTFSFIKDNETEKFIIPKDIINVTANTAEATQQAAMDKILADQRAKEEAADAARQEAAKVEEPVQEPAKAEEPAKEASKPAETTEVEGRVEVETTEVVDNSAAEAEAARKAAEAEAARVAKEAEKARKAEEARQAEEAKKAEQAQKAAEKPAEPVAAEKNYNDAMLKSKPGLVFRVQIAAGPRKDDPASYQSKYGITDAVVIEEHEGLNKYVVGEFGSYRPAKTFSNELRDKNGVVGTFVTAYNNGVRIHVQEALNIAGE